MGELLVHRQAEEIAALNWPILLKLTPHTVWTSVVELEQEAANRHMREIQGTPSADFSSTYLFDLSEKLSEVLVGQFIQFQTGLVTESEKIPVYLSLKETQLLRSVFEKRVDETLVHLVAHSIDTEKSDSSLNLLGSYCTEMRDAFMDIGYAMTYTQ